MLSRETDIRKGIDWPAVIMYLVLVICGWLSIYGASYDFDQSSIFSFDNRAGKQFVWILTAFMLAGTILLTDYKIYDSLISNFIYIAVMLLLVITIVGGIANLPFVPDIKGSRSWIVLGPVSFQPAELAKIATALAVSRYLSVHRKAFDGRDMIPAMLLLFVPFCLIILQKETGSALVFAAFLLVFYREGMSGLVLLSGVLAVLLFIIIVRFGTVPLQEGASDLGMLTALTILLLIELYHAFFLRKFKRETLWFLAALAVTALGTFAINLWKTVSYNYVLGAFVAASCVYWAVIAYIRHSKITRNITLFIAAALMFCFAADYLFNTVLKPHQQTRIKIVLNMEDDPSGAGYNVAQSKIAIGSGGFAGKGFLNGTQTKLKYVPEQDTDFIFCTVGEEFGFVGAAGLLCLYAALLLRLIHIAERQRDAFNRIYGYCVVSIFFFHLMVNIGMVIGLMPVIGIPLPFFSYGGSSLWAFTVLLFILLRLDASRGDRLR